MGSTEFEVSRGVVPRMAVEAVRNSDVGQQVGAVEHVLGLMEEIDIDARRLFAAEVIAQVLETVPETYRYAPWLQASVERASMTATGLRELQVPEVPYD